jgi:Asp-tRNA(Asn)/Glu-tRNA(Gln) amidotransferase A subunit family amidase
MLQVLAGYDPGDPASIDTRAGSGYSVRPKAAESRIGVPREFFFDGLHPEVAEAVKKLSNSSADSMLKFARSARSLHRPPGSRRRRMGAEPLRVRILELDAGAPGERVPQRDDALRARKELKASRHAIRAVFEEVDVLLTPTVPIPPPVIAELRKHPANLRPQELIMLRNTRPFNVWGIPTISVPCGFTKDGLPIGLQLAAAPWAEDVVLQAAHVWRAGDEWHEDASTDQLLRHFFGT